MRFLLFQFANAVISLIGKPWTVPWTAETIIQVSVSLFNPLVMVYGVDC